MSRNAARVQPMVWFARLTHEQQRRVNRLIVSTIYLELPPAKMALRSGLSKGVVQSLRSGEISPTMGHLEKLAPLIGATPAAVLSGEWTP